MEQISQPLWRAERAEEEIGQGVGLLRVQAMDDLTGLIEGSVDLQGEDEVRQDM